MSALARAGAPGRHIYDAIVVGTQFSGLLAGALLAKRGCAVLFAPVSGESTEYEIEGWRLPSVPDVFESPLASPLIAEIAAELALTQVFQREVPQVSPQLILPRQRISLSTDTIKREKELARVFGAEAATIWPRIEKARAVQTADDAFLASRPPMPAAGFWQRWTLNRHLKRSQPSGADFTLNEQHALEGALLKLGTHLEVSDAPLSRARLLARSLDSLSVLPGGRAGLEQLVRNRAREIGGADVTDLPVSGVVFDGSKPVGVQLARSDTVFKAPLLIAACDTSTLIHLLPETRQKKALPVWVEGTHKHHFVANALAERAALPPGLGQVALVPVTSDFGSVLITIAPAQRADGKPTELLRLTLSTQVPEALMRGGAAAVTATATSLWEAVDGLLPFTRAQLKRESFAAHDAEKTTRSAIVAPGDESTLGVTRFPIDTPFKNLLLANREVVPGLRLEGEALTALRVTQRVEKILKKPPGLKAE